MTRRSRLTVGSLRGVPQNPANARRPFLAPVPPSKRGKGCCRKGCQGCPFTLRLAARVGEPPRGSVGA